MGGRTSILTSARSLEEMLQVVLQKLVRGSDFLVQKAERSGWTTRALRETSCNQQPRQLRLLATSAHCMKLLIMFYLDPGLQKVINREKGEAVKH